LSAAVDIEGEVPLADGTARLALQRYDKTDPREGNLSCFDRNGEKLLDAEAVQSLDKWVAAQTDNGRIFANSYGGFLCELDPKTGKIISSTFVK
jgi:hypothetical protein